MLRDFFEYLGRNVPIHSPSIFLGASAVVLAYFLYITLRRPKHPDRRESEL